MSRVLDLTRLIDQARVKLPGALDAQIKHELFFVCDEFFKTSEVWKQEIDFVVNTTDLAYDIVQESGLIERLVQVENSNGFGVTASMTVPNIIDLVTVPNATDTFTATCVMTVSDPVASNGYPVFPDWILAKYMPVLLDGVLARMMATLAKPYSSEKGAMFHGSRFSNGVHQAKVDAQHKNVRRGQSWAFPKFA